MSVSLKRRLERVMNKMPVRPSAEQLSAHAESISYLDHFALRKAQGDADVQQEIELICRELHKVR